MEEFYRCKAGELIEDFDIDDYLNDNELNFGDFDQDQDSDGFKALIEKQQFAYELAKNAVVTTGDTGLEAQGNALQEILADIDDVAEMQMVFDSFLLEIFLQGSSDTTRRQLKASKSTSTEDKPKLVMEPVAEDGFFRLVFNTAMIGPSILRHLKEVKADIEIKTYGRVNAVFIDDEDEG